MMHRMFGIFGTDDSESHLSLSNRALLAADRWRIMSKHCLMLVKGGQMPNVYPRLKEALSLIKLGDEPPPAETAAAPRPAETAPPSAEAAAPWWHEPVPYRSDGIIDWEALEEGLDVPIDIEAFECEILQLDYSKPQASNIHTYLSLIHI